MIDSIIKDLESVGNPIKAAHAQRFFKTGPGEYGEGDQFIGVTVPEVRSVIKNYRNCPFNKIEKLLHNPMHECRLAALLILVDQFKCGDELQRKKIVDLYLRNTTFVNNWDLVDTSAYHILGAWLEHTGDTSRLDQLAASRDLWEERIAMIATLHFIRKNDFAPTLRIAETFLHHPHDLMHKAVGWMLREVGKRDEKVLTDYLQKRYRTMPRTMLRYAIEKFDEHRRKKYLHGKI